MNIALFTDTFPPEVNGVSHTVYISACSLASRGHTVTVYTVSSLSQKELNERFGKKFQIITIPSSPALAYPGARMSLPLGFTLPNVHHNKPDIIHVHTPFAAGWEGILAARMYDIPLVGTHHTFLDHYLKHIHLEYNWAKVFSWKYTSMYYNRCDMVLSPTCSLRDELLLNGLKSPIQLLVNSIDTDAFHPPQDMSVRNGRTLVYMGRVSYEKSIDETIHIVAELVEKFPDIRLKVIGDGPEKNNLEALAASLHIADHVTFSGFLYGADLVNALATSDIYVTTSKSENMPLAVLEAMAVGLPIVAVSSLGMAEIIADEENGFLISQHNPEQVRNDMKLRIETLLTDNMLREQMAQKSRELSLQYSEDTITDGLLNIYTNLIQNHGNSK